MVRYRILQCQRADGKVMPYGMAYQYEAPRPEDRQVLLFVPHWRTQRRLDVDDLLQLSAHHYPSAPYPLQWSEIKEWSADPNSSAGFRPIQIMQEAFLPKVEGRQNIEAGKTRAEALATKEGAAVTLSMEPPGAESYHSTAVKMRHIVSILVENESGVLARVAGLFAGRGFNIEELSVAETLDPTVSRITLVTTGDDQIMEQIVKQLNKLVCVIKVVDFQDTTHVEREMVLIKVAADERNRSEVLNIVNIFRAKVIDVDPRSYIIEITGDNDKIQAFLNLLKPLGIREIVRTGKVAMQRGMQVFSASARGEAVELSEAPVNKQLEGRARKGRVA